MEISFINQRVNRGKKSLITSLTKQLFGNKIDYSNLPINRCVHNLQKKIISAPYLYLTSFYLFWIHELPEHIFECRFRWLDRVNILPDTSHPYGLTPVWMRRCWVKWLFWPNAFPRCSHLWDFSPVWVTWWNFKWPMWAKDFTHTSQKRGLTPVSVLMCCVRCPFCVCTEGAGVRFRAGVSALMCLHVIFTSKWFTTIWTNKWLFSCVNK